MSQQFINATTSSTESETKAYGQWSYQRELAAIEGMIEFRPFEAKRGEVTTAWNKIFRKVNKIDGHLKQLSDNAIKNRIKNLIEEVKEKLNNDLTYGTGSNDSETTRENRVLDLISLMKKNEESKTKGNEDAAKTLAEKRRLQCHVVLQSRQGINKGKKISKMDDNRHKSDDEVMSSDEVEDCMGYELPLKEIEAKRDLTILMKTVEKERTLQSEKSNVLKLAASSIEKYAGRLEQSLNEQRLINNSQRILVGQLSELLQSQQFHHEQNMQMMMRSYQQMGNLREEFRETMARHSNQTLITHQSPPSPATPSPATPTPTSVTPTAPIPARKSTRKDKK
ncbi:hypothetical protein INT47_006361 [Mucor saturninus]|uniref:Uncharacterized protein n=1 Tax=Mucor saturninus TaxID=64648 RepID=A0A8H7RHI2_9FUNG|nr:hypothetical protein INT47_006361 [Mucor saturninus]